ncbi:MAG: 3-oxoadipate enol-lactonase [Rhizobiaceae bacterium]|nr:3-oxoadipate enol-lactonase [Rhizobiaceae bacterium]
MSTLENGEHQIDLDDVNLACRVDGPADAPWLILSNSLATDYRMWDLQLASLVKKHRVLRYDTRGHGRSSAPTPPYDFDKLVNDVVGLMDRLQITSADFVGLSLGGMTGLGLALQHRDRIKRLVCCDARADAPDIYQQIWPANIANAQAGGMQAVASPTLERWFTEGFRNAPSNTETLAGVRDMIMATSVAGYTGSAACLLSLDYLKDLGMIAVPVLYVGGAHDPAAPAAVMRDMAAKTPGARFEEIPDAAHLANIENPEAFNRVLAQWL